MTTPHIAGLIKGLKEHDDPFRHFGSLLGYFHHLAQAIELGLIFGDLPRESLTEAGERYYADKKLDELPDCNSYNWCRVRDDDSWA